MGVSPELLVAEGTFDREFDWFLVVFDEVNDFPSDKAASLFVHLELGSHFGQFFLESLLNFFCLSPVESVLLCCLFVDVVIAECLAKADALFYVQLLFVGIFLPEQFTGYQTSWCTLLKWWYNRVVGVVVVVVGRKQVK